MSIAPALNDVESGELARHEAAIGRGLKTFVEVGTALLAIRDGRLYREAFGTFEDYCRDRWGLKQSRAYQYIDAARVIANLADETSTIVEVPATESQCRPLARLEPEQQRAAWQEAVESAPDGKPTARDVEAAAARVAPPDRPRPHSMPVHAELLFDEPEPADRPERRIERPMPTPAPAEKAARWGERLARLRDDVNVLLVSLPRRGGFAELARDWPADAIRSTIAHLRSLIGAAEKGIAELEGLLR